MFKRAIKLGTHNLSRAMSTTTRPTPIICCGRMEKVGNPVIASLKPEFEAVHFFPTDEDCIANIPRLLRGEDPVDPVSTIGSGNYSNTPVAVMFGGGYTEDSIVKIRDATRETSNVRNVVWLRADMERTKTDRTQPGAEGYPEYIAKRIKDRLTELRDGNRLDGKEDELVYY